MGRVHSRSLPSYWRNDLPREPRPLWQKKEPLGFFSRKIQGAPQPHHSKREMGMAVVSGRMGPRVYPSTDAPPALHATHFVWPGATRRCFALLCFHGAVRLCGERLGSVGMGVGERVDRRGWAWVGGWVGLCVRQCAVRRGALLCSTRRCVVLLGRVVGVVLCFPTHGCLPAVCVSSPCLCCTLGQPPPELQVQ